jgi:hypothetical protein
LPGTGLPVRYREATAFRRWSIHSVQLIIPAGKYLLRCELFAEKENGESPVRFTFAKSGNPQFRVIRADAGLILDGDLLTEAQPALR